MPARKPTTGKRRELRTELDWAKCLPVLLVAAVLCAYLQSFKGVFVFDDAPHILQKERIRQLWPLWELIGGRRPISDLTLAVNHALGEFEVWGYHAVNVSIHILAALTLYGIVRRTMARKKGPADSRAAGFNPREHSEACQIAQAEACGSAASLVALVVALVWAVHPLQTQSVTYLIQRCESLMGLFYLLTLYCVIRGADSARPAGWHGAGVVFCILGMGSKAVMVTAPVMVLLYDRVFLSASFTRALRRRWGLYIGLAASWGVLWACGVAEGVLSPYRQTATVGFSFRGVTPLEYAVTQPGVLMRYLGLSLWPHPLCVDYGWPVARSVEAVILPGMVIVGLLGATVWGLLRRPSLGFVGVWFFLILAPTSSFIPIKDAFFEHRMYLSLASVVVLLVLGGHAVLRHLSSSLLLRASVRRSVTCLLGLAAVATLAYGTIKRNESYDSELAIWQEVVDKRPQNVRALYNVGTLLLDKDELDGAIQVFEETLRIEPSSYKAHYNLGKALSRAGRIDEAARHYIEALRISPDRAEAHNDLGNIAARKGESDEAIRRYREAIRTDPGYIQAYYNLGTVLLSRGEIDEAVAALREAVRLSPDTAKVRSALGNALMRQGKLDEAAEEHHKARQLDLNGPEASYRQ